MRRAHLFIVLHVICSSSVYAAAFPELSNWKTQLQNKLVMPCQRTVTTTGVAHSMFYHQPSHTLIISRTLPFSTRVYRINMQDHEVFASPYFAATLHQAFETSALALAGNDSIVVVGATPARVCIISDSGEPISVRVKSSDNIIKLGTAVPLAGIMAIYARNWKTNKKRIGLCSIADRSIHTFVPTCSPDAEITSLALSSDGSNIAWGTNNGSLYVRSTDADAKERLLRSFFNKKGRFNTLTWSPDKGTLACSIAAQWGSYLFLITTRSGTILHEQKMSSPITACTFTDNTTLAFCTTDKTHIHKLHMHLPGIRSLGWTLEDLTPSARKLCQKTATCSEPYELQPSEQETYKKLPELLRHAWLLKASI